MERLVRVLIIFCVLSDLILVFPFLTYFDWAVEDLNGIERGKDTDENKVVIKFSGGHSA